MIFVTFLTRVWTYMFTIIPNNKDSSQTNRRTVSIIKKELDRVVKYATDNTNNILSQDESIRLSSRFNIENVHGHEHGNSYSVNKEHMHVCLQGDGGAAKPFGEVFHEAVHLLAHLVNVDVGHGGSFWDIKDRLMKAGKATACVDLEMARNIVAARRIQRAWRVCVSCPMFHVCQRRLIREWHEWSIKI